MENKEYEKAKTVAIYELLSMEGMLSCKVCSDKAISLVNQIEALALKRGEEIGVEIGVENGKKTERGLWQENMQHYSNALRMVRQVLELEVAMKAEEHIEPPIQNEADEIIKAIDKVKEQALADYKKSLKEKVEKLIGQHDTHCETDGFLVADLEKVLSLIEEEG